MQVERAPESVYLFGYHAAPKDGASKSSAGNACLAEHTGRVRQGPVVIFTRTPGVEKLVGDRVEVGGEEFRDKFTVTSVRPEEALKSVNAEVERIPLEHAAGPGWYLSAEIGGRHVLVSSHWAKTEQDWDYLIALARRLRTAVRQRRQEAGDGSIVLGERLSELDVVGRAGDGDCIGGAGDADWRRRMGCSDSPGFRNGLDVSDRGSSRTTCRASPAPPGRATAKTAPEGTNRNSGVDGRRLDVY